MKKLVIFLFALLLALSLAGCEQGQHAPAEQNPPAPRAVFSDDFGGEISIVPIDVTAKSSLEGAQAQL